MLRIKPLGKQFHLSNLADVVATAMWLLSVT